MWALAMPAVRCILPSLGRPGTGKSSFLRYLSQQDIEADRRFLYFNLHGDAASFLKKLQRS